MVHVNIGTPSYLCLLDGFLMSLDVAQLRLGDPRVLLGPVVRQEEPGDPPHDPQGPEDVEDGGPPPEEPHGDQPAAHWQGNDGAYLHAWGFSQRTGE